MKKFGSIAVVVVLLLAAAIYYGNLNKKKSPTPDPQPDPDPVVKVKKPTPKEDKPDTSATMDGTLKLTAATSHGGFDSDVDTMNSVLTDITGGSPKYPFTKAILDY